jgi:hypothetical protein
MLRDTQTSTRMLACAGVRGEEDLHMLLSWRKRAFSLSLSLSLSLASSLLFISPLSHTHSLRHTLTHRDISVGCQDSAYGLESGPKKGMKSTSRPCRPSDWGGKGGQRGAGRLGWV